MLNEDFCHLHVHNEFSLLDGFGSARAYVKRAKELGFDYLGLTNHGNIDGLIQFQKACDQKGVSPVMGCEAYIVPDLTIKAKGEKRGHITILVKNQQGFENLCQMLTVANLEGFYYKPRIDFALVKDHLEGLIFLTGCGSTFLALPGGEELLAVLSEKSEVYLEIMPHSMDDQKKINRLCSELAAKYGLKMVATNDAHYILPDEDKIHEVLLAIQTKAKMSDANRFRFVEKGLCLRTADEMIDAFNTQDVLDNRQIRQAIKNTVEIAEKCKDFRIRKQDIYLPTVPGYENVDCSDFLQNECSIRLNELVKNGNWSREKFQAYKARIDEGWELINKKNFASYFMVVWELINWCHKNDLMVGPGRGSVGGSLIAYLLGITTVDPIKFNLLFSRFIAANRIDYPDIDMDFEDKKRHLVREHLEKLYGKNNVTSISTFLTMKGRAAIRDVARVFDIPLEEVDPFAKMIEAAEGEDDAISIASKSEAGKDFYEKHPEVVKIAIKLEGQVRGTGQHAAGVIISADDLTQGTRGNLAVRSGLIVSNWNMADSEFVGLMKLDVLGLNTLSILSETKRLVKENHDLDIVFESIPLDDKAVYKEISAGNNVGVFQLSAWATTKLAKEIKCSNIGELSDIIALVRPGPTNSGMTSDYIKRKHGARWKKKHPIYEAIVTNTYGVVAYQEQVMEIIHKVAGLPYVTADKIRKIIGKKRDPKEFKPFEEAFIKGCSDMNTLSEDEAKEFWVALQETASYLFNRSHSIEYAILGFWTAWCKKYYPPEFICASLTYGSEGKKNELIKEAYRIGLNVILPQRDTPDPSKWTTRGSNLYIPFVEIKGIGEKTALQPLNSTVTTKKEVKKAPKVFKTKPVGFFSKQQEPIIQMNTIIKETTKEKTSKLAKVLEEIASLDLQQDTKKLSEYFSFEIQTKKSTSQSRIQKLNGIAGLSDLDKCYSCPLGSECEYGPVSPSKGKYNIMIVGEAPGKDEDKDGQGFVGKAGQLLWEVLATHKLFREQFYITNICKCYPKITKTPNQDCIEKCSSWLLEEIKQIQPALILAFGNTSLKGLKSKYTKITEANGQTEMNPYVSSTVNWCIHPSAVLHNPANQALFEEGINHFTRTITQLGGLNDS